MLPDGVVALRSSGKVDTRAVGSGAREGDFRDPLVASEGDCEGKLAK